MHPCQLPSDEPECRCVAKPIFPQNLDIIGVSRTVAKSPSSTSATPHWFCLEELLEPRLN